MSVQRLMSSKRGPTKPRGYAARNKPERWFRDATVVAKAPLRIAAVHARDVVERTKALLLKLDDETGPS